tara:strand:- start:7 stop:288 length:282 start_codon:yes stop_codon:yes gene_type:complete
VVAVVVTTLRVKLVDKVEADKVVIAMAVAVQLQMQLQTPEEVEEVPETVAQVVQAVAVLLLFVLLIHTVPAALALQKQLLAQIKFGHLQGTEQ